MLPLYSISLLCAWLIGWMLISAYQRKQQQRRVRVRRTRHRNRLRRRGQELAKQQGPELSRLQELTGLIQQYQQLEQSSAEGQQIAQRIADLKASIRQPTDSGVGNAGNAG